MRVGFSIADSSFRACPCSTQQPCGALLRNNPIVTCPGSRFEEFANCVDRCFLFVIRDTICSKVSFWLFSANKSPTSCLGLFLQRNSPTSCLGQYVQFRLPSFRKLAEGGVSYSEEFREGSFPLRVFVITSTMRRTRPETVLFFGTQARARNTPFLYDLLRFQHQSHRNSNIPPGQGGARREGEAGQDHAGLDAN